LAKEEQLFISVQIDEHIGKALAVSLKRHGYDVVTTVEAGLLGASDSEQLAHAAATKRAILTFNILSFLLIKLFFSFPKKRKVWLENFLDAF